jgi:hypothetical protein
MTEQEKALYSVVFRLNGDSKDTVNACIKELLANSAEKPANVLKNKISVQSTAKENE